MEEINVTYKNLHEHFVTGHNGTTLAEISLQLSVSVAGVLLRDCIVLFLAFHNLNFQFWFWLILDFVCIVFPLLLVSTILSSLILQFFISLLCLLFFTLLLLCLQKKTSSKAKFTLKYVLNINMMGKRPFIDYFRAFVNIGTAVVILGVDFTIFPRRFSKAETYGSGFMDVGVGCFVIANAVVSIEARGKQKTARSVFDKCMLMINMIKSCVPLVVLGFLRVLAVKRLDYQEHVSEYGVHWNFFLTLAVVKIVSTIILTVFPVRSSGILSIVIAIIYQYFLSQRDLSKYIRHGVNGLGTRHGVLDANREGICASIGYIAIYLAGVQLGSFIFKNREKLSDWLKVMCYIVIVGSISGFLMFFCKNNVEPISRRMCNAAYIFWMIALNHQLLASYLLGDVIITTVSQYCRAYKKSKVKETPCLLRAVNYNALGYFLLANVLTGLVNMSIKTIQASPTIAFSILLIYMFILSFITMFLYKLKISTKFW